MNRSPLSAARLAYLKADQRLAEAQGRARHWNGRFNTQTRLEAAQKTARAAWAAYQNLKN